MSTTTQYVPHKIKDMSLLDWGYTEIKLYNLPKHLDEKVVVLQLPKIGKELETLGKHQADYIGVKVEGPFKPEHYGH